MTDIDRILRQYANAADPPPSSELVAADLARGRRAVHRRRLVAGALALSGVAAAAVVVVASVPSPHAASHENAHPRPGRSVAPSRRMDAHAALVAYTGRQPAGFTVATVPRGYVLQSATSSSLDIARAGDRTGPDVFVGKLVVTVNADAPPAVGHRVEVNGRVGSLHTVDGVRMLAYGLGRYHVSVQAWRNITLTDEQLIAFAGGIGVTSSVVPLHG